MTKINVSTTQMKKFAGKWVVIDPVKNKIIAWGKTLREIAPLVTRPITDTRPTGVVPYSHFVAKKIDGLYIL